MECKKLIFAGAVIFILAACSTPNIQAHTCCEKAYTDPAGAINCFSQNNSNPSASEKLLLIAFTREKVRENQEKGWSIIKDTDIRNTAKMSYALVIMDWDQYKIMDSSCTSLTSDLIWKQKSDIVFVIANQAMCPFSYWTSEDDKETVLEHLAIGNGP